MRTLDTDSTLGLLYFRYSLRFTDQGMSLLPIPVSAIRFALVAVLFLLASAVWTMVPVAWGNGPASVRLATGLPGGCIIFLVGCVTISLTAWHSRQAARSGPLLQFDGSSVILGNNVLILRKNDLRGAFVVKGKARREWPGHGGVRVRYFPVVMIGFVINENGQQRDIVIGFHTHTHWKSSINAFGRFCEQLGIVMERIHDRALLDARRLPLEYVEAGEVFASRPSPVASRGEGSEV